MSKLLPEWIQDAKQRGAALIALEDRKEYETQGSILWHEHGLDLVTKIENQADEIKRLREQLVHVGELPVTADGVPVVPGSSTVWRIGSRGEAFEQNVNWNGWGALFLSDVEDDGYWPCWDVAKLYSTREAAEAAGGDDGNV